MTDLQAFLAERVKVIRLRVEHLKFCAKRVECGSCDRDFDAILLALKESDAALRAYVEQQGWQPIDNEAKNGDWRLVVFMGDVEKARWDADHRRRGKVEPCWLFWRQGPLLCTKSNAPTHWMPLPAPPASEA